ncbi:hypothetical protein DBR32_15630, partial [Taibaiella sp. KBW10]|uniref:hypothetical protein n=1 Tax=Taibaiella sp. KBW10 TaxID=2153357 RepID=UPI000FA6E080
AVISTAHAAIGSSNASVALPSNSVNTGEQLGGVTGNDGTVNGRLPISVTTNPITKANFGIQALPTPSNLTAASQVNPGGTATVIVPPATFSGTDPDGGTISAIRITAFPTGATSITINNVNYTNSNFPTTATVIIPAT